MVVMTDIFKPDAKRKVQPNECANTNRLNVAMFLVSTEHLENRKLVPSNDEVILARLRDKTLFHCLVCTLGNNSLHVFSTDGRISFFMKKPSCVYILIIKNRSNNSLVTFVSLALFSSCRS